MRLWQVLHDPILFGSTQRSSWPRQFYTVELVRRVMPAVSKKRRLGSDMTSKPLLASGKHGTILDKHHEHHQAVSQQTNSATGGEKDTGHWTTSSEGGKLVKRAAQPRLKALNAQRLTGSSLATTSSAAASEPSFTIDKTGIQNQNGPRLPRVQIVVSFLEKD